MPNLENNTCPRCGDQGTISYSSATKKCRNPECQLPWRLWQEWSTTLQAELVTARQECDDARLRLLSAAGDDLCRLTQEEIKQFTSGEVQIPPKEEFLPSCERFWEQTAARAGVLPKCFTLAQLISENERHRAEHETLARRLRGAVRCIVRSGLAEALLEKHATLEAAFDEIGVPE